MTKQGSNKNIFFLTRPFSNLLDAGTKNIPYYISMYSRHYITVIAEKEFSLKTADNVRIIRTKIKSIEDFTESSRSIKNKFLIFALMFRNMNNHKIIHAFFAPTAITSMILLSAKILFRKILIVNIPYWKKKSSGSTMIKFMLQKADMIITMSEYSMNDIGKYARKSEIIHPVIDKEKYSPCTRNHKDALKRKLGLNAGYIAIYPGEYGALDASNNLEEIVKIVSEKIKGILFIFSCRLKTKGDIEKEKIVKSKLHGYNVLYLNTIDNYHEYAAASDIAIFPAGSMEGKFDLPLALVELMAMGKPVIHTDIPPLNELYRGKEGFCFPNDPEAVAYRIIKIAENRNLYENLSEKTLREAKRFLPENVIPQYDKIYEKLIRSK